MAFNGSGTFNRIYNWTTDAGNGINIEASRMDGEDNGFATGLSNCITKDGQTTITANIPFNSKKITGLANGSARTDSIALGQVQDNSFGTLGTLGGSADTYTASPSPAITAYATGSEFNLKVNADNTGASTLNISALGAKNIKKYDGAGSKLDLEAGDLQQDQYYKVIYDGTDFVLSWSSNAQVNNLKINNKLNTQPNTATISSGAITYTNTYMVVDTEASASTDDLDTINGGSVGDILIIRQENDGRDITFKHAGGNINLTNGIEFSFVNTRDRLVLQYDGSFWVELSRSLDVEIRHSIDYDNGVSKSYNTIYQASEAGYLVIQLAGSFRNAAQLLVGSASPPTTQVGIWGDDINGNTKAVSASYPISKGTYYKIAPATIGVSSDAWETVDFKFYPIKPS